METPDLTTDDDGSLAEPPGTNPAVPPLAPETQPTPDGPSQPFIPSPLNDAGVSNEVSTEPMLPNQDGFLPLDDNYVAADRVYRLIVFAVLFIGVIVGMVIKYFHNGLDTPWYLLAAGAAIILVPTLWAAFFWPRIEYRHTQWRLDEVGLEIHKGVIWKHRVSVPLARVQHADVSQGPLERSYGLGTLTIHTAGTSGAEVTLSGLNYGIAMQLRDRLVRQRRAENVTG